MLAKFSVIEIEKDFHNTNLFWVTEKLSLLKLPPTGRLTPNKFFLGLGGRQSSRGEFFLVPSFVGFIDLIIFMFIKVKFSI